jgi:hypothetical protein
VSFHDLYAEGFDPLLPACELPSDCELPERIAKWCDEIASAEGIVIVHPNWWGQLPAILKGWIDRVIRPGVAYRFLDGDDGEGTGRSALARTALVLNTANTRRTANSRSSAIRCSAPGRTACSDCAASAMSGAASTASSSQALQRSGPPGSKTLACWRWSASEDDLRLSVQRAHRADGGR